MIDVLYDPPDPYGLDWADPGQVSRYQESQNEAIRQAFDEVRHKGNNPNYIKISGMSPEELVSSVAPWPGELKFFDGTLAQATSWGTKYGWAICDGTKGTPDLRDQFVCGASATEDAGGTGGAATHTHAFTGAGHSHGLDAATTDDPGDHAHTLSGTVQNATASHTHTFTGAAGACTTVLNMCGLGSDGAVSIGAHTHGTSGTTDSGGASHNHYLSGINTLGAGAHTHGFGAQVTDVDNAAGTTDASAAGAALPPYYEVIILRKTEWNIAT